ncbi:MAG TPA: DUF2007 domain-containing protein [Armatimonadota bacterium]|nr:DUF2007 domain-containing protein [Armatimonadota bacterium]
MATCPTCGKNYPDTAVGCPDCAARPTRFGPEHDLKLVSVYRAEDEMSAHLIHGALVNNGIPAHIHSEQAPTFGTLLRLDHGCWGEVMVPIAYQERALEVVQVFTTEDPAVEAAAEQEAMMAPPEEEELIEESRERESIEAPGDSASTPAESPGPPAPEPPIESPPEG